MPFYLRGRIFLTALPPTPSPQSGRGRLWGNRRFLPHLSEADVPPQRSAKPSVAAGHGAFVGEPQVPAAFERSGAPSQNSALQNEKRHPFGCLFLLVGEDGFEPSKSVTTDLQSAPFGRSGILPYTNPTEAGSFCGAGGRLRTPDLLITNQLLYLLSYTSLVSTNAILS